MSLNGSSPIVLDCKPANSSATGTAHSIATFQSYNFDRNILTPASAFRFTAPGVDKNARTAIRSGDLVVLTAVDDKNKKWALGTGFIDETDTHVTPSMVEYVITGRDTLGQLVDNAAVDAQNKIQNTEQISVQQLVQLLIANTRLPASFISQQVPNGRLLVTTSPGETKINVLQRYTEFMNCLVWVDSQGRIIIGKPNFSQEKSGFLVMSSSAPDLNNCLEVRVRRNLNQAIRQIVTQLQTLDQVDAGQFTVANADIDMRTARKFGVGRSVYERFSYGSGNDVINQVVQVGNQTGNPQQIGAALSRRNIARENVKVLDCEVVLRGHFNENGFPYNIDQIYNCQFEDDDVSEDLYVYACSYELTLEHGALTRLRLCRVGTTLVDGSDILPRSS